MEEGHSNWAEGFKAIAIGVVLFAGVGTGAYYLISRMMRDKAEASTNKKTHIPGEPESYAATLVKALAPGDWFISDAQKETAKLTMRQVAMKGIYSEVQQAYTNLTAGTGNLDADLRKRLTQPDNDLITLMIKNNPDNFSNGKA